MSYTTYLFDFDYTLADSSLGIVTCFQNVLTRHGYVHVTDEAIKRTIGKTLEDSFSILTEVTDAEQLAGFKKEYSKEADTHMTVNTVFFLETKSVLLALKDAGARVGIISTKYRYRIQELIDQHFPGDFFDIIIGGEDVTQAKPSPEGVLLAIKRLKIEKAEVLYIGDSTIDAETAESAGVDFAGVLHGMTTAEELRVYPHKMIMKNLEGLLQKEDTEENVDNESATLSASSAAGAITLKGTARLMTFTFWKSLIRWVHIKQIGGRPTPKAPSTPNTCKNCGDNYTGKYCNRCGQSQNTPRYNFRYAIRNILAGWSNIDNGFGRNLIEFLYRPGYMINDYIKGKRVHYFRPFQTMFVLAALYIMFVQLIDPDALRKEKEPESKKISNTEAFKTTRSRLQSQLENTKDEKGREVLTLAIQSMDSCIVRNEATAASLIQKAKADSIKDAADDEDDAIDDWVDKVVNTSNKMKESSDRLPSFLTKVWNLLEGWAHGNKAVNILLTLPLFTIATRMAFRRRTYNRGYNYTEHFFTQTYIACQILLVSILYMPFHNDLAMNDVYDIPWQAIFLLFCWDYKQLFRGTWFQTIRRTVMMFLYSLLMVILLAALVVLLLYVCTLIIDA